MTAPVKTPLVSILTTTYNALAFLPIAVESVLAQTVGDWELIIVDDGSTDGTREWLAQLRDPRIETVLLERNVGRRDALALAFDRARAKYIAILDADDVWRADRLERQLPVLETRPDVVLVGSWARQVDEAGVVRGTFHPPTDTVELHDMLGWGNPIVHSAVLYRADVARRVGGYPASMLHSHDFGLWLRMATVGSLAIIPELLCDHRIVDSSMTRGPRFRTNVVRDGLVLAREARMLLELGPRGSRRNREERTISEVKWALYQLRNGRPLRGLAGIVAALLRNPLVLVRSHRYRRQYLRPARTSRSA